MPFSSGVCRSRSSASTLRPRSSGRSPTRTYGFFTASGTCQEIRICVLGSAPKARWRPKGVMREPGAFDVLGHGPPVAVAPACPEREPEPEPEQPVSSPLATAPAVTSVRRRDSRVRRYSCCSAMLIRPASSGGMPKWGISMSSELPSRGQRPHHIRVNGTRRTRAVPRSAASHLSASRTPSVIPWDEE